MLKLRRRSFDFDFAGLTQIDLTIKFCIAIDAVILNGSEGSYTNLLAFNICDLCMLKHCGSCPVGELLFCQQQQKSNQKNAAPIHLPR
jgi:hypothetical protein